MASKMRVAELREFCTHKGFNVDGLTRVQMLNLLKDSNIDEVQIDEDEVVDQEGNVDEFEDVFDDSKSDVSDSSQQSSKAVSHELRLLELKLKLAESERLKVEAEQKKADSEWEREKERMTLLGNSNDSEVLIRSESRDVKHLLPRMDENGDVLSFFYCFEKTMQMNDVPKSQWAKHVPGLLNSKSCKIYARLSLEVCRDYDSLKQEILRNLRLTPKSYLAKFRQTHRSGEETYSQFLQRLADIQNFYLEAKDIVDFQTLKNDMLFEQISNTLWPDIREFVEQKGAKTASDVARWADVYWESRQNKTRQTDAKLASRLNAQAAIGPVKAQELNPKPTANRQNMYKPETNSKFVNDKTNKGVKCFVCSGPHFARECKIKQSTKSKEVGWTSDRVGGLPETEPRQESNLSNYTYVVPVFVNGQELRAVRDTGAQVTCVSSKVAEYQNFEPDGRMWIRNVENDNKIPTWIVELSSPHFRSNDIVTVKVGVAKNLSMDILLGNDIFKNFPKLIDPVGWRQIDREIGGTEKEQIDGCLSETKDKLENISDSGAMIGAITRSQTRNRQLDKETVERTVTTSLPGVHKRALPEVKETTQVNSLPDGQVEEPEDKTDNENASSKSLQDEYTVNELDIDTNEQWSDKSQKFKQAQVTDKSLVDCWIKARMGHPAFLIHDGLLYSQRGLIGYVVIVIVLPTEFSKQIL
jgi:hypothetical protein